MGVVGVAGGNPGPVQAERNRGHGCWLRRSDTWNLLPTACRGPLFLLPARNTPDPARFQSLPSSFSRGADSYRPPLGQPGRLAEGLFGFDGQAGEIDVAHGHTVQREIAQCRAAERAAAEFAIGEHAALKARFLHEAVAAADAAAQRG